MPYHNFLQISEEKYNIIVERNDKFIALVDDPNQVPCKVFDPLSQKHLEELELIREVSRSLTKKRDEDLQKAASKAEDEAKADAKEEISNEETSAEA